MILISQLPVSSESFGLLCLAGFASRDKGRQNIPLLWATTSWTAANRQGTVINWRIIWWHANPKRCKESIVNLLNLMHVTRKEDARKSTRCLQPQCHHRAFVFIECQIHGLSHCVMPAWREFGIVSWIRYGKGDPPSVRDECDFNYTTLAFCNVCWDSRSKECLNLALPVSPHVECHVCFGFEFKHQSVISASAFFSHTHKLWGQPGTNFCIELISR